MDVTVRTGLGPVLVLVLVLEFVVEEDVEGEGGALNVLVLR
jgi:hypothetical protein